MAASITSSRSPAVPTLESTDSLETKSVQLEWKVGNLKQLFEQTKGDAKSKCVKSALFDNSRWQVFLYPNSGHEQYVSLYLSCEPTAMERERALAEQAGGIGGTSTSGDEGKGKDKERVPWRRDGKFKFTFDVRSLDRRVTFKQMEADNHSFTWRERNWGYASMISRREAYYNNPNTRNADAFLVVCTITSSPSLPSVPSSPQVLIPKNLVHAYASLFDDPAYADVLFRIRPENGRRDRKGNVKEKRLYAARKILAGRSEYFDTMFNSGFSETTIPLATRSRSRNRASTLSELDDDGDFSLDESDEPSVGGCEGWDEDDDSAVDESEYDEEEGEERFEDFAAAPVTVAVVAEEADPEPPSSFGEPVSSNPAPGQAPTSPVTTRTSQLAPSSAPRSRTSSTSLTDDERDSSTSPSLTTQEEVPEESEEAQYEPEQQTTPPPSRRTSRFVDALSAPQSPAKAFAPSANTALAPFHGGKTFATVPSRNAARRSRSKGDGRARFEVIVTDAAYSTFRSLLNYLYTDSITFAPLASTYYVAKDHATAASLPFAYSTRREYLLAHSPQLLQGSGSSVGACSSKAIYRLADKMGLTELKERAYEHVVQSLTAQNIVYEVFGSFSQRFDEIRRVEVAFLLEKWNDVRSSPQMRKVFDLLRTGRFPGFEDVWIELVQCLEVVPTPPPVASAAQASAAGEREVEDAR
ncbi:hypothetical protein JCM11641_003586 [Rhodosporidiobolus odoratus]